MLPVLPCKTSYSALPQLVASSRNLLLPQPDGLCSPTRHAAPSAPRAWMRRSADPLLVRAVKQPWGEGKLSGAVVGGKLGVTRCSEGCLGSAGWPGLCGRGGSLARSLRALRTGLQPSASASDSFVLKTHPCSFQIWVYWKLSRHIQDLKMIPYNG